MPLRLLLTLAIFALTMLLVIIRPRKWPEALWTCLGAALLLALRFVSPHEAVAVVGQAGGALLFLAALLPLAALIERSGFFDWTAIVAAQRARGRVRVLYRNVFILGALVTTVLSLDTTAVILTPIVLSFVRRLQLPPRPFVFACAFVANTASLLLPVSNLSNLIFAASFHFTFGAFALRMLLPSLTTLAVNYWLFVRLFRDELPAAFAADALPAPASVIHHRGYFRWSVGVLVAVCLGYFVAPLVRLQPYDVGFVGCAVLAGAALLTRQLTFDLARRVQWSIFPFVIGLFIVVRAVQNVGLDAGGAALVQRLPHDPFVASFVSAFGAAIASNLVNNLPAALLARDILHAAHASNAAVYGALLGTNLGPNIVVIGSLATMLVLTRARADGDAPSNLDFLRVGLRVTPLVLAAAALTLGLVFLL
ncbi:MAG TPA: ArsB/NhaD family transporter [Polyangia bacterium]|jgi:arsenical pump membrane protein|nr:ArsB/NhaD family transporter [Polyangia bacterium]